MLLIFRSVQTSSMNIGPGFGIQKDSAKFSFDAGYSMLGAGAQG